MVSCDQSSKSQYDTTYLKVKKYITSNQGDTMTEEWGRIIVYHPSMAAKAADMFNAFSELWPGGFGGGVPYDEQRVRDWLDNTSALADLIALDEEGNLVGYCGLYPHYRDSHAAYISLLGVHPEVVGKRYGKRLLLKALEIAAKEGVQRVDLNTWSGNLKAMPLYKKVGLVWVPDTSVYMQDYIPGLLQIPLAEEWFSAHPDWYTYFKQELTQGPDKRIVDGMEVYIYEFEANNDRLTAEVDRYAWRFCSIERVLKGKKIAVKTRLLSHDIFIGIPNRITIEIVNETGEDLPITLQVNPFKGLKWIDTFPESFTVKNGEFVRITRKFVVDSTAAIFNPDKASEVITWNITINDQPLVLFTGGRIRPAVAVSAQTLYTLAPPGKETVVYLDVINHTEEEVTGEIDVVLTGDHRTLPFTLSPQEVSGIEIPVAVPDSPPAVALYATPFLKDNTNAHFSMPSHTHSVVPYCRDLAVVITDTNQEECVLLTDFVAVHIKRERGRVRIAPPSSFAGGERIDFDVGPPYGLSLDRTLTYGYDVTKEGKYTTIELTGTSILIPGAQIKKYIRVAPGMHEVEFWVTLTNITANKVHAGGRMLISEESRIVVSLLDSMGRVFTPLKDTIIESDPSTNFMSETLVPQDPACWKESWTAAQKLSEGSFFGWIWKPEPIDRIEVWNGSLYKLESKTEVLNPGEVYEPVHIWYTFSHSSLQDIRRRWNQLVGRKEVLSPLDKVVTTPPVTVMLADTPFAEKGKTSKKQLEIHCATAYPLPGVLTLILPPRWKGHFVTGDGVSERIPMPVLTPGNPAFVEVELSVPVTPAPSEVVQLHFSGEFELDFDIPFLLVDQKSVKVKNVDVEGHETMEVSNGVITFQVVTGRGGNLIRLKDSKGHSFFADNFPEIKPRLFINYNIGGIQPFIFTLDREMLFLEPEKTEARIAEEGLWKGVEVFWTIENQELLRGQQYCLKYLTLPGSSVVRVRLEHHNPTRRLIKWVAMFSADLEFQKSTEDMVLTAPGGTQTWVRNRVRKPFLSLSNSSNPWVKASKGDQSLVFLIPEGFSGVARVLDVTEMMAGLLITLAETEPKGMTVTEFAFAVNESEKKVDELRKALEK